ncbi:hypothetical protein Pla123a_41530 [Posidoniimonas polymericola]|uniref:IrrE N-terminal-like domain-containing protein n=2 Tax=Posidoniimonas polymericola TaxID=2528002 RepID=A0A5C5XW92_9BACT|nr:hypothetical protein Pla123a_41530 [Posidoniimonas polymericola]
MTGEISVDEVLAAVEMVAREVLWEAGVDAPPVDAIDVARRLGCRVVAVAGHEGRASRVALSGLRVGGDVIRLRADDRPERRQWSVAHELGELLAGRVYQRLALEPADTHDSAREEIANQFASSLLLPRRWFLPQASRLDWSIAGLKSEFATASHELIARRVLALYTGPIAVTVVDNGSQTWRRGCRWRPPPPCHAELEAWKTAFDSGQPVVSYCRADKVRRVRAWPVHEPDWKREILLTDFEEAA